ncbi:MAG: tetratricopeptide repeat protein [Candidatus Omnitrophota bacterium]|nr:tetratricopeptide repeat protein [Candidatus Omnitrophota bacterium]
MSSKEIPPLYQEALEDFRHDRNAAAIEKLNRVIAAHPAFEDAHEALSVILYNQKKYDEAITCTKKWVKLNPNCIMAHTNLSRCYVAKEMILEAEDEQNEARRLTWKSELKSKQAEMPKVDHAERIERFKQVIEIDPADVLGYYSLGTAYFESGKKREAMDTFEKAIEVDAKHTSSYLGLGMALEAFGDKAKARKIYERGIQVATENGDMMPQKKMEALLKRMEGGS